MKTVWDLITEMQSEFEKAKHAFFEERDTETAIKHLKNSIHIYEENMEMFVDMPEIIASYKSRLNVLGNIYLEMGAVEEATHLIRQFYDNKI